MAKRKITVPCYVPSAHTYEVTDHVDTLKMRLLKLVDMNQNGVGERVIWLLGEQQFSSMSEEEKARVLLQPP